MARRGSSPSQEHGNGPNAPEYIEDWDEYFLGIALMVARKSKDPRCRVGAVIVSKDKLVLSTGFNGLARGVFDDEDLLANVDEKLKWICHAEINSILNAARTGVPVKGCAIFVNKFPCFECCNAIAQAGIERIYTHDHRYWDDDPVDGDHSRKPALLKQARIRVDAPFHPSFRPSRPFTLDGNENGDASRRPAQTVAQVDKPEQLPLLRPVPRKPPARTLGKRRVASPRRARRNAP